MLQWIDLEKQRHKAPIAYWLKKKIITENIYGVDIMEEATEIAKLRLFLALVASAESRDQLEPLPNIEFNILSGNSLIGLIKVDSAAFDRQHLPAGKQAHLKLKGGSQPDELGFDVEISIKPSQKEKRPSSWPTSTARNTASCWRRKTAASRSTRKPPTGWRTTFIKSAASNRSKTRLAPC